MVMLGVAVVGAMLIWMMLAYNKLVALRLRFRNAFAQIDVQLKRRYDLIPNLVETAKTYLKHERETLEAVVAARNVAVNASRAAATDPSNGGAMQNLLGAESKLTGLLGRLMAVSEAYPDLKANETMMQLTEELTTTENRVGFARQAYNDAVMHYNTQCETFPSNLVASGFRFSPAVFFEVEAPQERLAPKVKF